MDFRMLQVLGMLKPGVWQAPPDVSYCLRLQSLLQCDREKEVCTNLWNIGKYSPRTQGHAQEELNH
jgi:hypothetical protein